MQENAITSGSTITTNLDTGQPARDWRGKPGTNSANMVGFWSGWSPKADSIKMLQQDFHIFFYALETNQVDFCWFTPFYVSRVIQ